MPEWGGQNGAPPVRPERERQLSDVIRLNFVRLLSPELSPEERVRVEQELALSYRPLLRALMVPLSLYFAFIALLRVLTETGLAQVVMTGLSLLAAIVYAYLFTSFLPRAKSLARVEAAAVLLFAMAFAPTLAGQILAPAESKLMFFAVIALGASAFGVTLRVIIATVTVALAAMMAIVVAHVPELALQYLVVSLGTMIGAGGIASLMRGAITREIHARLIAQDLRGKAEIIADHDGLTGLPNRRRFFTELERLIAERGKAPYGFSLASVDLDAFRPINDLYGHAIGDELLVETARRLQAVCPENCYPARLGGDEFAILIRKPMSVHQLQAFGERIRDAIAEPFDLGGTIVNIAASVGIARHPRARATSRDLFEQADYALYKAKRDGSDGVELFTKAHEREMTNIGVVDHALRNSDLEAELHVEFQPQFDITTDTVVGFEALARWDNGRLGRVRPDVFIVAAERCGMIEDLTRILLTKALAAARDWPAHIRLSFNLSARDIVSSTSLRNICRIVRESGIDSGRITFEITETSIVSDFELAVSALERLRELGARLALDDFGSGYSNFGHIDRLALNEIKVDRSFIRRLSDGANTANIVKTIIGMCTNLGLDCIIEGVESMEELQIVKRLGARYVQGFLLGKPMTRHDVPHFLERMATPARKRA